MVGSRRKARVIALTTLYEIDTVGHSPEDVLQRHLDDGASLEAAAFARHLVSGVIEHRPEIDQRISKAAPAWPIDQMAKLDKNILRLAIFEILFDNSATPVKAVINEAVELAKTFGSDTSSKFVNGVLGTITSSNA